MQANEATRHTSHSIFLRPKLTTKCKRRLLLTECEDAEFDEVRERGGSDGDAVKDGQLLLKDDVVVVLCHEGNRRRPESPRHPEVCSLGLNTIALELHSPIPSEEAHYQFQYQLTATVPASIPQNPVSSERVRVPINYEK